MPSVFECFTGLVALLAILGVISAYRDHVLDRERPHWLAENGGRYSDAPRDWREGIVYDEVVEEPEPEWEPVERDGAVVGRARFMRSTKLPPGPVNFGNVSPGRFRLGGGK